MTSSSPKLILVTGANQGLGFAIIQAAALRYPDSTYILTSRSWHSGDEARKKLRDLGVMAIIDVIELDVTNDEQIANAVGFVKSKYGKLDVLINNAGISGPMPAPAQESLSDVRNRYNNILNTNLTSVAVLTHAFTPVLHASPSPKIINISSGLGSMTNALTTKMGRAPAYGASKVGVNGLSVHLQVEENDRIEAGVRLEEPRIKTFVVAPGLLKTAFTKFSEKGRDPVEGAEVVVRLVLGEEGEKFEGGSFLEWAGGEVRRVPW